MQTLGATRIEQRSQKRRLHERLAARESHATFRLFKKNPVPENGVHDFPNGHPFAHDLPGGRRAGISARAAHRAIVHTRGQRTYSIRGFAKRTGLAALATSVAAVFENHNLGTRRLTFGIMAPRAAEWTALEEDGGANARAIVQGIFLDVEDQSRICHWQMCGGCAPPCKGARQQGNALVIESQILFATGIPP